MLKVQHPAIYTGNNRIFIGGGMVWINPNRPEVELLVYTAEEFNIQPFAVDDSGVKYYRAIEGAYFATFCNNDLEVNVIKAGYLEVAQINIIISSKLLDILAPRKS